MPVFDLATTELRNLNQSLHAISGNAANEDFEVINPRGAHAIATARTVPRTCTSLENSKMI